MVQSVQVTCGHNIIYMYIFKLILKSNILSFSVELDSILYSLMNTLQREF